MSTLKPSNLTETSLTQDVIYAARYYLGGRRGLIILTIAALGAGAALNWSWLVAMGVAPLILAVAPCAIMCGLGLCMSMGRSCSAKSEAIDQSEPGDQAIPAHEVDTNGGVDASTAIAESVAPSSATPKSEEPRLSETRDKRSI